MSDWYYVDASRIRRGPLDAAALAALVERGELHAGTRVWRDGMARWQPVAECLDALGLRPEQLQEAPAVAPPAESAGAAERSGPVAVPPADASPTETRAESPPTEAIEPPALPEPSEQTGTPVWHHAGLAKRFAAFMIDELILTVALMPVIVIVGLITGATAGSPEAAAMNLLRLVATWLYFSWCESSSLRGTIGKRALGLYVTRPHGAGLSFARASARFLTKVLGAMAFMIGIFLIAVHPQRQGLHDQVTDTYVVADNADKLTLKPFEWILIALGIFAVLAAWSTLQAR